MLTPQGYKKVEKYILILSYVHPLYFLIYSTLKF